jgi:hypothetical protein
MYLCLSKHHLLEEVLLHLTLEGYLLGCSLGRHNLNVFLLRKIMFTKFYITRHCKEYDLELYALQIES